MFYGHKPWEKDVILAIPISAPQRGIFIPMMTGRWKRFRACNLGYDKEQSLLEINN